MPAVEILFDQAGESMYTQSGGMVWRYDRWNRHRPDGEIMKGVGKMLPVSPCLWQNTQHRHRAQPLLPSTVAGGCMPVTFGENE